MNLGLSYCQALSILDELDWTENYDQIYRKAINDDLKFLPDDSDENELHFHCYFKSYTLRYIFKINDETELFESLHFKSDDSKEWRRLIRKHGLRNLRDASREARLKSPIGEEFNRYANILLEFGGSIAEAHTGDYPFEQIEFDLNEALQVINPKEYFEKIRLDYYKSRGLTQAQYELNEDEWGVIVQLYNNGIVMDAKLDQGHRGSYFNIKIYQN